ncbi:TPA: hypothetical protein ACJK0K_002156 [Acinetobacter baumannii]
MDKPMTFIEWCSSNGKIPYSLGLEGAYEAGQQSMQAKVEELQTQLSLQRQRVKAFEEELTSSRNYGDELQKRVDAAIKCADLNFWNENTVKAMVEALKGEKE